MLLFLSFVYHKQDNHFWLLFKNIARLRKRRGMNCLKSRCGNLKGRQRYTFHANFFAWK